MKSIILFVALITFQFTITAQKTPTDYGMDESYTLPKGIEVGAKAPLFKTSDIEGNKVSVSELLKSGPVIVLFYRGEWCPACNRYLSELNNSLPAIKEKGASVIVVSPELVSNVEITKKKTSSDFVFVSDKGSKICKSYDVLFTVTDAYQEKIITKLKTDIKENNGSKEAQLPVPATFIIGTDGKVIFKQFDYDYHNRASGEEILKML